MSRISIADLPEYTEEQPLANGPYELEIGSNTKAELKDNGRTSLQVELRVLGGPAQPDESEPEGRARVSGVGIHIAVAQDRALIRGGDGRSVVIP